MKTRCKCHSPILVLTAILALAVAAGLLLGHSRERLAQTPGQAPSEMGSGEAPPGAPPEELTESWTARVLQLMPDEAFLGVATPPLGVAFHNMTEIMRFLDSEISDSWPSELTHGEATSIEDLTALYALKADEPAALFVARPRPGNPSLGGGPTVAVVFGCTDVAQCIRRFRPDAASGSSGNEDCAPLSDGWWYAAVEQRLVAGNDADLVRSVARRIGEKALSRPGTTQFPAGGPTKWMALLSVDRLREAWTSLTDYLRPDLPSFLGIVWDSVGATLPTNAANGPIAITASASNAEIRIEARQGATAVATTAVAATEVATSPATRSVASLLPDAALRLDCPLTGFWWEFMSRGVSEFVGDLPDSDAATILENAQGLLDGDLTIAYAPDGASFLLVIGVRDETRALDLMRAFLPPSADSLPSSEPQIYKGVTICSAQVEIPLCFAVHDTRLILSTSLDPMRAAIDAPRTSSAPSCGLLDIRPAFWPSTRALLLALFPAWDPWAADKLFSGAFSEIQVSCSDSEQGPLASVTLRYAER